jgi:hypothetical protein
MELQEPSTELLHVTKDNFHFQVLFNFVMFETFDVVDLFIPTADALWSLICCHQVRNVPCTVLMKILVLQSNSSSGTLSACDNSRCLVVPGWYSNDYCRRKISHLVAKRPSTSCVRTACPKLSTSLEQAVNNL